jgi:hypothetical protein
MKIKTIDGTNKQYIFENGEVCSFNDKIKYTSLKYGETRPPVIEKPIIKIKRKSK